MTSYGQTAGFLDRDQRLPPSPPLSESNYGLMEGIRARCRHAVKRFFGAVPIVLNSPCTTCASASTFLSDHCESKHQNCPFTSTAEPISKSRLASNTPTPTVSNNSVAPPPAKRRRHSSPTEIDNDQVVPNSQTCHTPDTSCQENCVCVESLWNSHGVGLDPMLRTAEELSNHMILLYRRAVDVSSNRVDYATLRDSPDFHHYTVSARKLRYFDPLLLSHSERKAFFLNVYNSLMIHAMTVLPKPRTMFDRITLYNTAAYNIGGRSYTLNMIEHGVLRSNRCGSGPFSQPQFDKWDARRQCVLSEIDPRIHFALNCGARSCPPVRFYEVATLDASLDSATRSYLLDLQVDMQSRTVIVPKLLQWYKTDFSEDGDMDKVLEWTLPYLEIDTRKALKQLLREKREFAASFKVSFASYDWTVNEASVTSLS